MFLLAMFLNGNKGLLLLILGTCIVGSACSCDETLNGFPGLAGDIVWSNSSNIKCFAMSVQAFDSAVIEFEFRNVSTLPCDPAIVFLRHTFDTNQKGQVICRDTVVEGERIYSKIINVEYLSTDAQDWTFEAHYEVIVPEKASLMRTALNIDICLAPGKCPRNMCENNGICVKYGPYMECICQGGFTSHRCAEVVPVIEFLAPPRSKSVEDGSPLIASCKANVSTGQPIKYMWYFENIAVPSYEENVGIGSFANGTLLIDKFTKKLSGGYTCTASVPGANATERAFFTSVQKCKHVLVSDAETIGVTTGSTARLSCISFGDTESVRWMKNDVIITNNTSSHIEFHGEELVIPDVRESDDGVYTCLVRDQVGCETTNEFTLKVTRLPGYLEYCGRSVLDDMAHGRISRGFDAKPHDNPWHVTLLTEIRGKMSPFCGGVLVSRRFVLTAANCIKDVSNYHSIGFSPQSVTLLFGTVNCYNTTTNVNFTSYVIHEQYIEENYVNNIALIELDRPITYSRSIRPICLHDAHHNLREFFRKRNVYGKVSGCGLNSRWRGPPEVLQEVFIPYVDPEECQNQFSETHISIVDGHLCAGHKVNLRGDACRGDGGSGFAMRSSKDRQVLVGLVSFGVGRCDTNRYYSVFTDVGFYYDWIEDKVNTRNEKLTIGELPVFAL